MNEERLWAPWRYEYVAGHNSVKEPPAALKPTNWVSGYDQECFLCRAAADYAAHDVADHTNLVAWRGETVVVVLNRYPYSNGHLLVAPRRHVASLGQLTSAEHLETMESLARLTELLAELIKADGFNIGLNLGRVAGAGVPGHLHWHLVPRWLGDKNFMPVTAETQVIAQSLDSLWEMLTAELK